MRRDAKTSCVMVQVSFSGNAEEPKHLQYSDIAMPVAIKSFDQPRDDQRLAGELFGRCLISIFGPDDKYHAMSSPLESL